MLPLSLATLNQLLRNGAAGAQVGNLCGEHTIAGIPRHLQVVSCRLDLLGGRQACIAGRGSGRNSTCSCSTCADFSILAHACTWATPSHDMVICDTSSVNCSSYVRTAMYRGTYLRFYSCYSPTWVRRVALRFAAHKTSREAATFRCILVFLQRVSQTLIVTRDIRVPGFGVHDLVSTAFLCSAIGRTNCNRTLPFIANMCLYTFVILLSAAKRRTNTASIPSRGGRTYVPT